MSVDDGDTNGELRTAIRIKDLSIEEYAPGSSQEQNTSCHIRIVTYTTYSFISEADKYLSGRTKVAPAGFDICISRDDFWSSPDEPAVISDGKIPGAIQLQRIFASANVVAINFVM